MPEEMIGEPFPGATVSRRPSGPLSLEGVPGFIYSFHLPEPEEIVTLDYGDGVTENGLHLGGTTYTVAQIVDGMMDVAEADWEAHIERIQAAEGGG